jgi:acyl-CoA reductase-like NAD-dependent aldehyde dehydrogenase
MSFLSPQPLKMFGGGQWVDSSSGRSFDTRDPGNVVAKVAEGDDRDIDLAVRAARKAFAESGWATGLGNDRAVVPHHLADLIDKNRDIIAQIESLDVGKPVAQAIGFDVPNAAQKFRYYADHPFCPLAYPQNQEAPPANSLRQIRHGRIFLRAA